MTGWVLLRRFPDGAEARIAAGFLRAEGIEARLPDEAFLSVHPELGMSRGGHRIEVPAGQARRAAQLLDEREGPAATPTPSPEAAPRGLLSLIRRALRGQGKDAPPEEPA